jgi:hypothetical protein
MHFGEEVKVLDVWVMLHQPFYALQVRGPIIRSAYLHLLCKVLLWI